MFPDAARPLRQSFFDEPSTVGCEAVTACTVVIKPLLLPKASSIAFTTGASPFVVHDVQEMAVIEDSYVSWFTPLTTVCESSFACAEKTTFFASAFEGGQAQQARAVLRKQGVLREVGAVAAARHDRGAVLLHVSASAAENLIFASVSSGSTMPVG